MLLLFFSGESAVASFNGFAREGLNDCASLLGGVQRTRAASSFGSHQQADICVNF